MKSIVYIVLVSLVVLSCNQANNNDDTVNTNQTQENSSAETVKEIVWQSGLEIKFQKAFAEKCIEIPREEWMEEDPEPFCASTSLKAMVVRLNNQQVANKINAQIVKTMTGGANGGSNRIQSLKGYVNAIKSIESIEDGLGNEEQSCEMIDSTNRLLSIQIIGDYMAYGAAHPSGSIKCLNFDLETGNKITVEEILIDGYKRKIAPIVKRKLFKEYGSEGWEFKLTLNISMHKSGISFEYNQYEIGPYAMGAPSIFIKWNEIQDLLKKNPYINFDKYIK